MSYENKEEVLHMKKVNLNRQEIRWLENLIMNQITSISDTLEKKETEHSNKLLSDKKGLQGLFQKITNDKMRW